MTWSEQLRISCLVSHKPRSQQWFGFCEGFLPCLQWTPSCSVFTGSSFSTYLEWKSMVSIILNPCDQQVLHQVPTFYYLIYFYYSKEPFSHYSPVEIRDSVYLFYVDNIQFMAISVQYNTYTIVPMIKTKAMMVAVTEYI